MAGHISSDGNGGVNFSYKMIAVITVILLLVSSLTAVVAHSTSLRIELDFVHNELTRTSDMTQKLQTDIAVIKTDLQYIKKIIDKENGS